VASQGGSRTMAIGVSNHALSSLSSSPTFFFDAAKKTGKAYQSKSLGTNPALAQWLEEANAYYNAVQSGQIKIPAEQQAAYVEFLNQRQWAMGSMYGGNAGAWGDPGMGGAAPQQQVNPYGGELGPDGNWNYDVVSTKLGFTGDNSRNDIFGTDNQINLDQPSAKVVCEETMDKGVSVLKVTVTTSKGTAVYFYENYQDPSFKLAISVPNLDNVTGEENFAGKIEAKKFDPTQANKPDSPQSTMVGEPVEGQENSFYYEVESVDQTVDFHPKGGEVDESHYVYGNSTISTPVSSTVHVSKGAFPGPNGESYGYKVEVTHKDGKKDTYFLKDAFSCHINALNVTWDVDGVAGNDTVDAGKVPDAVKEIFTTSTGKTDEAAGSSDAQAIIDGFMQTSGLNNEDQLIAAFKAAGYSYDTVEDIKEAIDKAEFPPKTPDSKLVNLLVSLDEGLQDAIKETFDTVNQYAGKPEYDSKVKPKMQKAMDRLEELLKELYPKSIVDMGEATGQQGFRAAGGSFTIKNSDGTSSTHQIYMDPNGNFYI